MAQQPKVQGTDQMSQLTQLLNVFKGFTTTGSKQTAGADPNALAALSQIANSFTKENAAVDANALIQAAMQSAAQEFAPVLGKERMAGVYNASSTKQQADNLAVAKAGELARTIMAASAQYGSVAANAAGNAAQATRTVSSQPKTKIDPSAIITQAGGMGLMMLLKKAFGEEGKAGAAKKVGTELFGKDSVDLGSNILSKLGMGDSMAPPDLLGPVNFNDILSSLSPSYSLSSTDALSGLITGGGGELFADSISPMLDLAGGFGDAAFSGATDILDFGSSAALDIGSSLATDFAGEAALDFGMEGAYDALSAATDVGSMAAEGAAGIGFPYLTAVRAAGEIFDINEIQDFSGAISKGISSAWEGVTDFVSDPSIICTALYAHGVMDKSLYRESARDFSRYAKTHDVKGYYAIAAKYLNWMAKSRFAFNLAGTVFTLRAIYVRSVRRNLPTPWLGFICYKALYAINDLASFYLRVTRRK